jgi:hypothetical protein
VPNPYYPENVLHNNGDEIQMDAEGQSGVVLVRRFEGDGAAGGGLRILTGKHLEATADAVFQAGYGVTLDGGPSAENPTQFSVGGVMSGGTLDLSENTLASIAAFSGAQVLMPEASAVTATQISDSQFLMTGGQLGVTSVDDSTFLVDGGTVMVASHVGSSDFDATNAIITADRIQGACNWNLEQSHLSAGHGALSGSMTFAGFDGWPTTFGHLSASADAPLSLELECGAQLVLSQVAEQADDQPVYQPFADGQPHRLTYASVDESVGHNELEAGSGAYPQRMYVGDQTQITRTEASCTPGPAGDPAMELRLNCDLAIATDFQTAYTDWDSSCVNVVVRPVWKWDNGVPVYDDKQEIELISPVPEAGRQPVIVFLDVPCTGAFADLSIDPCYDPPAPLGVDFVNHYDNSAVDEGPQQSWTPRQGPGPAECGYFANITVGANRSLYFHTVDGVICPIYHTGSFTYDPSAAFFLDEATHTQVSDLIRHAQVTYYGDFNADCRLTNKELAELQTAINGGPSRYKAIYDVNCDGVLTPGNDSPELTRFLYNYANQPLPGCGGLLLGGGAGGMEESAMSALAGEDDGIDDTEPVDVSELAAWLIEQLSPEGLAAFVAQATATAQEHADDAIGAEMTELLAYLP